jgi:hypothetical protein
MDDLHLFPALQSIEIHSMEPVNASTDFKKFQRLKDMLMCKNLKYTKIYYKAGEPIKHATTKCIERVRKPYRALSSVRYYT